MTAMFFPTTPERSALMSKIGSKDTKPELAFRRACHRLGLRCRLHRGDLPGTPDFCYPSAKAAVFVDGDFWHGRSWATEGKAPKRNREAWTEKFRRNRDRDGAVSAELVAMGWVPFKFWETDVGRDPDGLARLVLATVRSR